jgi:glyoxylase-like metal-dependent hydrolase (beta-lactamase superfamily II)
LFDGKLELSVGRRQVELHHFDIHSADGNVVWLPEDRLLLAGDTLEDTITYVSEAGHIATHVDELARMRTWTIGRILPNHGDSGRIAAGGYSAGLIDANRNYLQRLTDPDERGQCEGMSLRDFIADDIASGAVSYHQPYEAVHRENISAVKAVSERP